MIKTVVYAGYAHKSNVDELIAKKVPAKDADVFRLFIKLVQESGITFDIIKYDRGNVTLITSPDWDTSNEPIVGTCMRWKAGEWFNADGGLNMEYRKTDNFRQIYHNKWQFVADNYTGFDLDEAKKRTEEWNSIPGIDKKRIGNKDFWIKFLQENGLPV